VRACMSHGEDRITDMRTLRRRIRAALNGIAPDAFTNEAQQLGEALLTGRRRQRAARQESRPHRNARAETGGT